MRALRERFLGHEAGQGNRGPAPYGIWRSEGTEAGVAVREVDLLPDLEVALQGSVEDEDGNPAGPEGLLG